MELESSYEDSVGHDNSGMTYDEEDNSHNTHETELSFEDDEIREFEHYENEEVEIEVILSALGTKHLGCFYALFDFSKFTFCGNILKCNCDDFSLITTNN